MAYKRETIVNKLQKYDINTLYQKSLINYLGITSDTKEKYTEVVSEWLYSNKDKLKKIKKITRNKTYNNRKKHTGVCNKTNRIEENIAKSMFNKEYDYIGKVLDYQVPLKSVKSDKAGKIDLIAYNSNDNVLRILELKKPESTETLLRCVLEGFTYESIVDKEKLLKDFELENASVISCPFIFKDKYQHEELKDLSNRPHLKKFMEYLKTEVYLIEEKDGEYKITKGL